MKHVWIVFVVVACGATSRPFDGAALYRSGRMHELRERLAGENTRTPAQAFLLARTLIDLRVVWDQGTFDDALAVLAPVRSQDPRVVAEFEQVTGEVLFWRKLVGGTGTWEELQARFERARALRESAGDTRGLAESTFYRGLIAQFTDGDARAWFENSLAIARTVDDPLLRSYPVRHLADLAESAGDLDAADRQHREALALRERAGDVIRLFNAQITLATFLCERRRDCEAARTQIEAARRTAEELRMPHGAIEVSVLDAQLAEWRGDLRARDAAWERTLALATAAKDDATVAMTRLARAAARLRARDHAAAIADARAAGSPEGHAIVVEAALLAGDFTAADAALTAAWTDAKPTPRLYLAAAAWIAARGETGAISAIASRTGLAIDARIWREAALAAARRDHDVRAELDALVSFGDPAHLDEARGLATSAHLPLY
jgi:hypothetical protein